MWPLWKRPANVVSIPEDISATGVPQEDIWNSFGEFLIRHVFVGAVRESRPVKATAGFATMFDREQEILASPTTNACLHIGRNVRDMENTTHW